MINIFTLFLFIVPIIIFSVTPQTIQWIKSWRIIIMWCAIMVLVAFMIYTELTSEQEIPCCLSEQYVHIRKIFISLWMAVLMNVYIGWWEFLWRCVYRQWTWPLLKNLQYGWVSNLCIIGSAIITLPLGSIILVVELMKLL